MCRTANMKSQRLSPLYRMAEHLPNVSDRQLSAVEATQMRMHSSMLAL